MAVLDPSVVTPEPSCLFNDVLLCRQMPASSLATYSYRHVSWADALLPQSAVGNITMLPTAHTALFCARQDVWRSFGMAPLILNIGTKGG
jgi:hypothetical protein